jgi:hypothetical protein
MDYPFKRGFKPDIDRIRIALEEEFPAEVRQDGEKLLISYGALKSIEVWIDNKRLNVVTDSQVIDTNKRYRNFLEKATGYTAKQRLQMAKKEVSK